MPLSINLAVSKPTIFGQAGVRQAKTYRGNRRRIERNKHSYDNPARHVDRERYPRTAQRLSSDLTDYNCFNARVIDLHDLKRSTDVVMAAYWAEGRSGRRVTALEVQENGEFCAIFENGQRVRAGAIAVASGVQYRRLPLERLADFEGSGVY